MTSLVGYQSKLSTRAIFTKVDNTRWSFLADFVHYQCYISIISKNHNLSITGDHQHVLEEVCGVGVVAGASAWTLYAIIMVRTTDCMIERKGVA